ncbi:Soluble epoxide hydrolase [Corynebacterium faecale]|nr:Soluble epoxide hydrolase [Corynebacterium faecale]
MNRTVASISRSPSVVALDGPYQHDNVYVRGVRLHVAVAGSSTDPLILLLHGAFGGWFDYKDVIAPLAARGFHVAAVDLRGYGLSDKPPSGYDLRRSAGDINGIIGALGHDSAILVGTDTGGSIAWSVSTLYPERATAVISLGAVHPVDLSQAVLRRPHLFGTTIIRIMLCSLPTAVLRPARMLIPRAARQEVLTHTTPPFQRSRAFAEAVKLRQKALSIDHTFTAIVRTNRLLMASLPSKLSNQVASCPVWLIRPRDNRTDPLAALARTRTTGAFKVVTVPGVTNLSFLEDPDQFTGMVAEFAQTV